MEELANGSFGRGEDKAKVMDGVQNETEMPLVKSDVEQIRDLVGSQEFLEGFVETQIMEQVQAVSKMEGEVARQVKINIGRSIPVETTRRTGLDPERVAEIRAIRQRNESVESMTDEEADLVISRWRTTAGEVGREFNPRRVEMEKAETKRLMGKLEQDSKWQEAQVELARVRGEQVAVVERLRQDVESRAEDPRLAHALDVWGRSIDDFIHYSEVLEGLIDTPDPLTNSEILLSAALEDDGGQRRLNLLTRRHDRVVAFARRGDRKPRVVTVIPGGDLPAIEKALDEEMFGQNVKNRLNKLGMGVKSVDPSELVR
ncbi:MAG: hypothetical protein UX78_C0005G0003 [Candidatus Amesbacteria bacterium GW2011_GWA2_47_11]|uniref:Uncharacterized protein n=1 Tax=Candidatus Amesbacteria bacterium GW2011_GWA2_47_11 TaxID=1618357 RepID=A0A0G1RHR2_9BACT|nr:MAG: hypothetical protein UX78_C0005G0003 [Candidatus Amesbacteria bacterium GW2011_GWA2_47_11]